MRFHLTCKIEIAFYFPPLWWNQIEKEVWIGIYHHSKFEGMKLFNATQMIVVFEKYKWWQFLFYCAGEEENGHLLCQPSITVQVVDPSLHFHRCHVADKWSITSAEYAPPCLAINSACFPCSTMVPFFTTAITSAFLIVDSLCATTIVDRCTITRSRASWTTCSDSASKALVASSSSKIFGSFTIALAIATLCFCPPESCTPRSPTVVLNPSGSAVMNLWAFATLLAASISVSGTTSSLPYEMFSLMVVLKSIGSWLTNPICCLNHRTWNCLMSIPSIKICPLSGS